MAPQKRSIEVFGLVKEAEFHQAKVTAEGLYQKQSDNISEPVCKGMIEHEWTAFLKEVKQDSGGAFVSYPDNTLVVIDKKPIGNAEEFLKWCLKEFQYKDFRPLPLYFAMSKMAYEEYLLGRKHDLLYMDIHIGKQSAGRLLIELFNDLLPITCENFKQMCLGTKKEATKESPCLALSYKSTIFHRVVKNGWIQGGDIVHGRGNNGWSMYGETFEDENYSVLHSKRGILGMANKGRHTNSSQFYFTFQPTPWMDCQYVAFGQVIEGLDVLDKLESVETYNERPVPECKIHDCGLLDMKNL